MANLSIRNASNKTPSNITTANNLHEALEFKHIVELERLDFITALFDAITLDHKHNNSSNTLTLAKLGSYLAKDFAHYTQDELNDLVKGNAISEVNHG